MKSIKLFLSLALVVFTTVNALEKPETTDINPETASLAKDFTGIQTRTGKLDVKSLGQRFGELRGKGANRTAAENQEYVLVKEKLRGMLNPTVFDTTFPE
jgi:hypothetical protein